MAFVVLLVVAFYSVYITVVFSGAIDFFTIDDNNRYCFILTSDIIMYDLNGAATILFRNVCHILRII